VVTLGEQCPVRSREDHANSCPETSVFGPSHFVHQQRLKIKQLRGKTLVFWASGSRQTGRARAKQCGMVIVLDLPAAMRIHGRLLDRPLTCPHASPCTRRCGASDTLSPWRGQRIKNRQVPSPLGEGQKSKTIISGPWVASRMRDYSCCSPAGNAAEATPTYLSAPP
jgi:hypothetical protein